MKNYTPFGKLCNKTVKTAYRYLKERQSYQDKDKERFKPKKFK